MIGPKSLAAAGDFIRCEGHWKCHPKYRWQFWATQLLLQKANADRAAAAQAPDTRPHLHVVPDRPPTPQELQLQLQKYGIAPQRAAQIVARYGAGTLRALRENPYRLVEDIQGITFEFANKLAERLGSKVPANKRIQAGLFAALNQARRNSHCALPEEQLIEKTARQLAVERSDVRDELQVVIAELRLIRQESAGRTLIYLPRLYELEVGVITHLKRLMGAPLPWAPFDSGAAIRLACAQAGVPIDEEQQHALRQLLECKVSALTGPPGTGKTTLTGLYVSILEQLGCVLTLCSPTARAACQLSKATKRTAQTIHRLLRWGRDGRFWFNASRRLKISVLVLDESSLADIEVLHALLESLPNHCVVLFVGDADQLPSVGPGQAFRDLLDRIPTIRLTTPHRQAKNSRIHLNFRRVNERLPPLMAKNAREEFQWRVLPDANAVAAKVVELVCRELPLRFGYNALRDIQVLTPMHGGELGTVRLNQRLQKYLNPLRAGEEHMRVVLPYGELRLRDRVIQQINDYGCDVNNGDIGFIERIVHKDRYLVVNFDGKRVCYRFSDLDNLRLAYAVTIHKTQGNEFPVVVMALALEHSAMLNKFLPYTGMSRAQRRLELVTDAKAIEVALSNRRNESRVTGLSEMARCLELFRMAA